MSASKAIELHGALWLTVDGHNFGGAERVALLAAIAVSGSITQAARQLKISYKAAWDAIDTMNNLAGEPLVARLAGGKGGGGTRLTARGQQLVDNFQALQQEHQRFVQQLAGQAQGLADDYLLLRRIAMKSSARNQFTGTVAQIRRGSVNDEVIVMLAGGQQLVATLTHESCLDLGLQPGVEVIALIKASSIMVMLDAEAVRLSARNQLTGTLSRIVPGAVNSEVVIELPGGASVAAVITHESCQQLALVVGQRATALFKASSVILAVGA